MGGLALIGASAAFFLPETLGQRLPETLAEAKCFGSGQPFWGIPKPHTVNFVGSNEEKEMLNTSEYSL